MFSLISIFLQSNLINSLKIMFEKLKGVIEGYLYSFFEV